MSTDDALLLQKTVREVFTDLFPSNRVREYMATEPGYDPAVWQRLVRELGLPGLAVEERHGGAGLSTRELALVFEEAGRSLACIPLFSVAGLAVPLLQAVGDETLLPQLVDGTRTATVVTADEHGRRFTDVRIDGDSLHGRAGFVVDGATSDVFLLPADDIVYAVERTAPGVTVTPLVTLDQTRKQAHVVFDAAPATRVGTGDIAHAYAISCAVLSAELVGVAQQCLDLTADYARTRVQFGRPIGSFQAIKQKLADLLIKVESARSAATAAAAAEAEPWTASVAKAYCAEAALQAGEDAIQLHGGIGFTWESDVHLYFKRARAGQEMLGTPREHYARVGEYLGGLR